MKHPNRNTLFKESTTILNHLHLEGDQHILILEAPEIAAKALPGSFVHVECGPQFTLRRPISIMRTDTVQGSVELLYKKLGSGTAALSTKEAGEPLSLIGPIGKPFELHPERSRPLLIGGGVGMPPMIFIAQSIHNNSDYKPFVILGSEVPFPFQAAPSQMLLSGIPDGVIASMPLLEDWGIPSRLASLQGYPGTHDGYVTDLARHWLDALSDEERSRVELFSCGPHPMLEAVAAVAKEYDLPCQVSLEEFMACGVGGCAGCVVQVSTPEGPAMKRVCVDGPVFEANTIFE
ncbi:MAG: dihydroorotate dehydrogenase electron transfer subunit [Gammaproteobacteria bacterium]|jgi:dihydroorotate dehydrogenase electron transfer subunit|nr:dihydroorotate dehydrogenase electron transfer subunit [Gammaproteobacteria bacterium]MBT3488231.1 dihydroorotate dehydrogenase electron transfer subunit [Gammaproteobacteria bacterium]MBT3719002.1 dihydroorotate dehydrogenase electron transfer subunit [Gammaproteobacteria bacterium]MBT3843856.1 dihydroorotate dehydrogenase electron transfer subunit [Gammaproteobacteria bacterium]MBT3892418.1 dihydroorotate dehydrogenase electron transfer subunit [Gammaproteobacteria bacterium]